MNHLHWTERQCITNLLPLYISISFAMDVFVPAIPEMTEYFHCSNSTIQASLYSFMLTVALGQLLIGPLSDRFGRRKMAQISALFFLIGSLISSMATSIALLLIARILQAIGACGTYLLCYIVIRDNYDTNACGRLFSVLAGMNSVIASSAPVIGGILLDLTHSWRSGFYFLSVLGIVITMAVFKNIPVYPQSPPNHLKTLLQIYRQILGHTAFRQYALIASSSLLGLYLFCALSPEILIRRFHNSGTEYGVWFGLNALTAFAANLLTARLTHWVSLERIVNFGLCIMVCATLLMIILNTYIQTSLSFMLPMLCLTVGIGISMGCAIALALRDFEKLAGTATAMLSACQFLMAGIIGYVVAQFPIHPSSLALPVLMFSLLGFIWNNVQRPYQTSDQSA